MASGLLLLYWYLTLNDLCELPVDWQEDADRKEETLAIVSDLLGFSWTGKSHMLMNVDVMTTNLPDIIYTLFLNLKGKLYYKKIYENFWQE